MSVGEPKDEMLAIMAHAAPPARTQTALPDGRGHAGRPGGGVACGVDMFDCVMPTRNARNGTIFTRHGDLKIRNARHRGPPAAGCHLHLPCLRGQTGEPGPGRARRFLALTLHHLDRCGEMLGPMLTTIHNLHYYLNLMREIRAALDAGALANFARSSRPTARVAYKRAWWP